MSRIFSFTMTAKAALIVILLFVMVFTPACRRKQNKSAKTLSAPVSRRQQLPEQDTFTETPAVESSNQDVQNVEAGDQNVEANDQDVVALSDEAKKETVAVLDTTANTKETVAAVPQTETQVAVESSEKPATTEQPSPAQPEELTSFEPLDLNSFGKMKDVGKKIAFISNFAGKSPESIPALVDMALDDKDPGVRAAAIDELVAKGFYNADIIPVVEKAMDDADPTIRQKAVDACANITDPAVSDVLEMALQDKSEDIRAAAIQLSAKKDPAIRLPVLEAGMNSQFEDVKAGAATELMHTANQAAVDILLTGLKDPNPEFHYTVQSTLNFMIGQEFDTYDQAKQWWDTNRDKFTDDLKPKE